MTIYSQERYYESRIQSIKTKDAEEKANLKLEIFELRDQCQTLKDKQKGRPSGTFLPILFLRQPLSVSL